MTACIVCRKREGSGALGICSECRKSYDRLTKTDDATLASVIRWAAKRAWWFAIGAKARSGTSARAKRTD